MTEEKLLMLEAELKPALARLKQLAEGVRFQEVLGKRVLVEGITPRTMMDQVQERAGIYIPPHLKKANQPPATTGIVLMVGPEVTAEQATRIPPGTMVAYNPHAGTGFRLEDRDGLRILDIEEILAVLETDEGVVGFEEKRPQE